MLHTFCYQIRRSQKHDSVFIFLICPNPSENSKKNQSRNVNFRKSFKWLSFFCLKQRLYMAISVRSTGSYLGLPWTKVGQDQLGTLSIFSQFIYFLMVLMIFLHSVNKFTRKSMVFVQLYNAQENQKTTPNKTFCFPSGVGGASETSFINGTKSGKTHMGKKSLCACVCLFVCLSVCCLSVRKKNPGSLV